MFSYIFVGIAGGYAFQRSGKVNWPSLTWLLVGATPGGFGGALLLNHISGTVVKLVLYALILASSSEWGRAAKRKRPWPPRA